MAAGLLIVAIVCALVYLRPFGYDSSKRNCASNLRTLGIACLEYAQDNDDTFPAPNEYGHGGWNSVDEQSGATHLDKYVGVSNRASNAWACPNLQSGSYRPPPRGDAWHFLAYNRSYAMNAYLRSPGAPARGASRRIADVDKADLRSLRQLPGGIHLSKISDPSKVCLLFEGIPTSTPPNSPNAAFNGYVKSDGDWTYVAGYWTTASSCSRFISHNGKFPDESCQELGLAPWHGAVNTYLYCDGHIRTHRPVTEGWRPTLADPGDFLVSHCRDANSICP